MKPLQRVPDWVLEEGGFDYSKVPGAFTQDLLVPVQEALAKFCYEKAGLASAATHNSPESIPAKGPAKARTKRSRADA